MMRRAEGLTWEGTLMAFGFFLDYCASNLALNLAEILVLSTWPIWPSTHASLAAFFLLEYSVVKSVRLGARHSQARHLPLGSDPGVIL